MNARVVLPVILTVLCVVPQPVRSDDVTPKAPPASLCGAVIPCTHPRGCADLTVGRHSFDEILFSEPTFAPTSCDVLEGVVVAGKRKLLSFDTYLLNRGPGDLEIGRPQDHPAAFEYAACHDHFHLKGYADYRLWTTRGFERWRALKAQNPGVCSPDLLAGHPPVAREMVAGQKQGFCVIDIQPFCTDRPFRFDDCDFNQGITAGWADIYDASLSGQWIDITDLAPGTYILEMEVNPLRLTTEDNYDNNSGAILVEIP